jgi:hypothetical protein
MKKLLDLLRSERPIVGGAFGRLSQEFGIDRATVRTVGLLILWIGPYVLGASYRSAWVFSVVGYLALLFFARRRDRLGSHFDRYLSRRRDWRNAPVGSSSDCNGYPRPAQVDSVPHVGPETSPAPGQPVAPRRAVADPGSKQPLGEALSDLEQRLTQLDQRIQKMETAVTDRAFDWDRRLRKG